MKARVPPDTSTSVLRVQEFAHQLRISVWTARQWAYQGKIASCKAGKLLLIPTSEISRLVAENTRPRLLRDERTN